MSRLLDRRLPAAVPAVRALLVRYAVLQLCAAVLTVAQAMILADAVARLVVGHATAAELASRLVLLGVLGCLRAVPAALQEWVGARASVRVRARLRSATLAAVRALGPGWAARQPAGRVVTAAGPGLESLDGYVSRALPAVVSAAVVPVVLLGTVLVLDWRSGLIVVAVLPLVPIFMALIGITTSRRMKRQYELLARMSGHFLDLVSGLATLRIYGRAAEQVATVRRTTDAYRRRTMATLRTAFLSSLVLDLVATLSVALVAVDIGLRLDHASMGLATGLTVLLLAPELFAPLRAMGSQHHAAEEGRTACAAALDIIEEAARDRVTPADSAEAAPVVGDGLVELHDVHVTYPGRSQPALHGVSKVLVPGETVALVGRSGAGKSTVLACLLGFVEPDRGEIVVGARTSAGAVRTALADLDAAAWRADLAWVPQRPSTTEACVADEVRLGDPAATPAQVAAAIAECHAPSGDTRLGEAAARISAGQLRRVALARAVLRARSRIAAGSVPVLLLDEPSEDLDAETEQVVAAVIGSFAGRATVLLATHSRQLVACADRVITLAEGAVVDDLRQLARRPAAAPAGGRDDGRRSAAAPADGREDARPSAGDGRPQAAARPDRALPRILPARPTVLMLLRAGGLSAAAGLAGLALTATSIWLICRAAQHPDLALLGVAVVGVRTFALARALLRYAERLVSHDGALRLLADVRARVFAALVPLVPAGIDLRRGDLLRRFVTDVDGVQEGLVRAVVPALGAAATGAGAVALATVLTPAAGLALALGLAVALVGSTLLARVAAGTGDPAATASGDRDAAVAALVAGLPELVAYDADGRATARIAGLDAAVVRATRRPAAGAAVGTALAAAAAAVTLPLLLAAAANAAASGALGVVAGAVLVACSLAAFDALSTVPAAAAAWSRFRSGYRRVAELLAAPVPVPEPPVPASVPDGSAVGVLAEQVSVAPATDVPVVVSGVDFRLDPGRRIAVIGPSGCGKSTLLAAVLRLLPARGALDVVGTGTGPEVRVPIASLRSADMPALVAGSIQTDHVFDASLGDNLRLVRPDATDADLDDAARRAGLTADLAALPGGWGTPAGADGVRLSGGQRQRLLLARAFLADPAVLVLDEPTAHLDAETESLVLRDLLRGTRGRTVLMSTHRPLPGTDGGDGELHDAAQDAAGIEVLHLVRPQDFGPSIPGPLTSVTSPHASAGWIPPLSATGHRAGVTR